MRELPKEVSDDEIREEKKSKVLLSRRKSKQQFFMKIKSAFATQRL